MSDPGGHSARTQYKPGEPKGNLTASWHSYGFNACNTASCWNGRIAPVIASSPLVTGGTGEGDGRRQLLMSRLDGQKSGYLAWAWNT